MFVHPHLDLLEASFVQLLFDRLHGVEWRGRGIDEVQEVIGRGLGRYGRHAGVRSGRYLLRDGQKP